LPLTLFKYNIICEALSPKRDEIYELFKKCIENEFVKELRTEIPPFLVRTDLSEGQIKEKIKTIVKPLITDIANKLYKL
jgi:hypothetical protein